jgi:membrane-associated phospholipid phosphatase
MKYNVLLVFICLIVASTGCQTVRTSPAVGTALRAQVQLPTTTQDELSRLPPVAAENSTSTLAVTAAGLVQPTSHYQLPDESSTEVDEDLTVWCQTKSDTCTLWTDICSDHCNFYTWKNAATTTGVFGVGAILAHTDADHAFRNAWQEDVRSNSWDNMSSVAHEFGEGKYVIAATVAAAGVGYLTSHTAAGETVGEWGYRSTRSLLVGFPTLLFLQRATGASRPLESSAESDWIPFHDENGVSGHAFVGAVPFICAARMTESRVASAALYACATFTGASRVNADAHYLSQVMLGWWLAHLACKSVDETENEKESQVQVMPISTPGGLGVGVQWQH